MTICSDFNLNVQVVARTPFEGTNYRRGAKVSLLPERYMSAVNIISFAFGLAAGFALLLVVARIVLTERRAARVVDRKGPRH